MAERKLSFTMDSSGLRERNKPTQADTPEEARKVVVELNAVEESKSDDDKHKKTYGRTPDGIGRCQLFQNSKGDGDLSHNTILRATLFSRG